MPLEVIRSVFSRLGHVEGDAEDALALQALAALPGPFLPWTTFSLRPAAVLAVLNDIVINDRSQIVECGSGNSTIFIARLLRQKGAGHITTIEHDQHFVGIIEAAIAREGLSEFVTAVHAPLRDGWYDRDRIPQIEGIDLLLVDGPPAHDEETQMSRLPALGHFALVDSATVILDDADRPGERRVLEQWRAASGREFEVQRSGLASSGPSEIAL